MSTDTAFAHDDESFHPTLAAEMQENPPFEVSKYVQNCLASECDHPHPGNSDIPQGLSSRRVASDSLSRRAPVVLGTGDPAKTTPTRPARCRKRKRPTPDKRRVGEGLALTVDQYEELHAAWRFARTIDRPLNAMLTIRPAAVDTMTPRERNALWGKVRNKVSGWFRNQGAELHAAWCRESKRPHGEGEHLHMLLHLPGPLWSPFESVVRGWFPGRFDIDLRPRDQRLRRRNKKVMSAISYLTKAAPSAKTLPGSTVPYRQSGPVVGKRAGVTTNLDAKAIARWRARGAIALAA